MTSFDQWARKAESLTLGGRTYMVQPPSVDDTAVLIAAVVRYEIESELVVGEVPEGMQQMLDELGPDDHPSLGDTHAALVADGVDPETIKRITAFMTFVWARSRDYAEKMAEFLWSPPPTAEDESRPKARPRGLLRSGRRTESASRTRTAGTPTTDPSRQT